MGEVGLGYSMGSGADERALFDAWCGGDAAAGDRLLQRHSAALYAFLFRATRDAQAAWDLVQETMLGCVEGRDRFEHASAFRTYLFAIAKYRLANHLTRDASRRRRTDCTVAALCDDGPSAAAVLVARDETASLLAAMAEMSGGLREVLELFYFESLQTEVIAERLGVPPATVRTRLHRARVWLRRSLRDDHRIAANNPRRGVTNRGARRRGSAGPCEHATVPQLVAMEEVR